MPLTWNAPLDPHEIKDYSCSWQAELTATSDTLSSSLFILPSDAAAGGVEISSQSATQYGGIVFLTVNPTFQDNAMYNEPGTQYRIRHQITTYGGRTLEISIYLTVKQK